ncbi:hypothetical protein PV332_21575 [Streptomyces scabiei]|uniref:hypothetical protein n=1 Tax=Streptomyces scabiei TaxID=1930 RepID=UPI0029A0E811|nr:hypothetical protein [Streptomyces scabiei]MDX2578049.1 hypothetical protein [Streptomyces scabiei]
MKRYELLADVYAYFPGVQDPDTGSWVGAGWDYENPRVVKATGGSIKPYDSLETFGAQYKDEQMVQLFMPNRPTLREQVGRIRNKAGEVQFVEIDGSPTTFSIFGVFPQSDANGKTVDYRVICVRTAVQQ